METCKRFLGLALATFMMAPEPKAKAGGRSIANDLGPPRDAQGRRRAERPAQEMPPSVSPCGRHVVRIAGGAVFIDGRRVHPAQGQVYLLAPPRWRRDGRAVAWLERHGRRTRLVVLPDLAEPLAWGLPPLSQGDEVFWAAADRIVVGPTLLVPRVVASW